MKKRNNEAIMIPQIVNSYISTYLEAFIYQTDFAKKNFECCILLL